MSTTVVSNWGGAIFLSLSNALNTFLTAIPQVIGALLILLIGWIIAGIVSRIVSALLARAGADRLFAEHGGTVYGARSTRIKPSVVAAQLTQSWYESSQATARRVQKDPGSASTRPIPERPATAK